MLESLQRLQLTCVLLGASSFVAFAHAESIPSGTYTLRAGTRQGAMSTPDAKRIPSCRTKIEKLRKTFSFLVVEYSEEAVVNGEKWTIEDRNFNSGDYNSVVVSTRKDDDVNVSVSFARSGRAARGMLAFGVLTSDKTSLACTDVFELSGSFTAKR